MLQRLTLALVVPATLSLTLAGCGPSYQVVPVAGKVTLDGKPLANVRVTFQPNGGKAGADAGPGSSGVTDAQGQYALTLISAEPQPGAVAGTHTVLFEAVGAPRTGDEAPPPDKTAPKVPATAQSFEVPAEGTDQANFDLKSQELQRRMAPRS